MSEFHWIRKWGKKRDMEGGERQGECGRECGRVSVLAGERHIAELL